MELKDAKRAALVITLQTAFLQRSPHFFLPWEQFLRSSTEIGFPRKQETRNAFCLSALFVLQKPSKKLAGMAQSPAHILSSVKGQQYAKSLK